MTIDKEELVLRFEKRFGQKPTALVRCPGRVNLIGEHIDYSFYPVLPMAIKQSTFVLVARNSDNKLRFVNTDPNYEEHEHDLSLPWTGTSKPQWYHYCLCGWKGALEHINHSQASTGIDFLVSGDVPPAAGLSSSSSVVCAALLATLATESKVNPDKLDRSGLADLAARVERYIGVEGGGMDQAVECMAEEGQALRVDFNPLHSTKVQLPPNAVFAVVHSGASFNKAATSHYNERVVECRLAGQIIAKRRMHCNWREVRTLRHLADFLCRDPEEMVEIVKRHFEEETMPRNIVLRDLETNDADIVESSLNEATVDMTEFHLRNRALHVFGEAQRVIDFQKACEARDIQTMGRLMNESHESCRTLYECSCPELDETVLRCREAGCLGARLTGAGWGGCVVALVDADRQAEVAAKLDVLFWSEPAAGIELTYL